MEIHIQKCQKCQSTKMKNILFREIGQQDKVFVQCDNCKEFVARYILAKQGYYHHGKGFESFLRSLTRSGEFMSGRRVLDMFEEVKKEAKRAYNEVLKLLEEKEKQ